MKLLEVQNQSAIQRLRFAAMIGLAAFFVASIVRLTVPNTDDSAWLTRLLCLVVLSWFVLRGKPNTPAADHLFASGMVLSSVLLLHMMVVNWIHGMETVYLFVSLVVMMIICAVALSHFWLKCILLSWTTGLLVVALLAPHTEIYWLEYAMMVYPLSAILYVLGSALLKANSQLEQQQLWLEKAQAVSKMAGWEYDPSTDRFIWSQTANRLLKVDDISGRNPSEFVTKDSWRSLYRAVMHCLETGEDFELTSLGHDGENQSCWYSVKAGRVGEPDRYRVVGVFMDVTETVEKERELTRAKERAEGAAAARTRFLANMSHEIRTPMNGVIGMASLLLDGDLANKERSYAEIIRNSGESLLTIINEILDFSKYETGAISLDDTEFPLEQLVTEALDIVDHPAVKKGLKLHLEMPVWSPVTYMGDSARLRQVLVNLLSNAVKFTETGSVTLRVSSDDPSRPFQNLTFEVIDTGIGITPAALPHLFDPFVQGDASTTRKFGGTGLGLAISREIVRAMNGEIDVYSHPKTGSRFCFGVRLKLVRQEPIPQFLDDSSKPLQLVSKDPILADIMSSRLAEIGSSVERFNAAEQIPEYASTVFLDIAYVPSHVIEDLDANPDVTVILLGPLGQRANFERQKSFWLRVPVLPSQLLMSLKLLAEDEPVQADVERLEQFNHLKVLLAEDNAVNQKVAQQMLKKLGCRADIAQNGRETVDMVEEQDYDLIFMDVQMPEVDGLEATRLIRVNEKLTQPYIVAMTANVMQEDRETCRTAGMNDFLAKPVRLAEVSKALRRASNKIAAG